MTHSLTHSQGLRTYLQIYAALMGLLVLTVGATYFDLGGYLNVTLALFIATIKAVLVILFFMHVRHGTKLTWIFAGAAFLWLGILLVLIFSDYLTRASASKTTEKATIAPTVQAVQLHDR